MLNAPTTRGRREHAAGQRGIVLILALIVLVALTLAAVALTRSVATSNSIAGNLAFQQASTHASDEGMEAAIAYLENNAGVTTGSCAGTVLNCNQTTDGYLASRADPSATQSWADFWSATLNASAKTLPTNSATATTGNTVAYVIQRMCATTGEANTDLNNCATSPTSASGSCPGGTTCTGGGGRGGTGSNVNASKQTYYRITVRVSGPRNTQSLVQATVAL